MIDAQDVSVLNKINISTTSIQSLIDFPKNKEEQFFIASYQVKNPKKPIIAEPQTKTISPIVVYCIKNLKNGTPFEQKRCLSMIAKGIENPKVAPQFLDKEISDGLFFIVNQDTSSFKAPTFKQKRLRNKIKNGKKYTKEQYDEAIKPSERELAESNKLFALALIAKIQNVLYEELVKRSKLKPSFYEMPASDKLIDISKNHPNNDIKAAAIGALFLMYRPEFDKEIKNVFEKASMSDIPQVKSFAEKSLNEINNK